MKRYKIRADEMQPKSNRDETIQRFLGKSQPKRGEMSRLTVTLRRNSCFKQLAWYRESRDDTNAYQIETATVDTPRNEI